MPGFTVVLDCIRDLHGRLRSDSPIELVLQFDSIFLGVKTENRKRKGILAGSFFFYRSRGSVDYTLRLQLHWTSSLNVPRCASLAIDTTNIFASGTPLTGWFEFNELGVYAHLHITVDPTKGIDDVFLQELRGPEDWIRDAKEPLPTERGVSELPVSCGMIDVACQCDPFKLTRDEIDLLYNVNVAEPHPRPKGTYFPPDLQEEETKQKGVFAPSRSIQSVVTAMQKRSNAWGRDDLENLLLYCDYLSRENVRTQRELAQKSYHAATRAARSLQNLPSVPSQLRPDVAYALADVEQRFGPLPEEERTSFLSNFDAL